MNFNNTKFILIGMFVGTVLMYVLAYAENQGQTGIELRSHKSAITEQLGKPSFGKWAAGVSYGWGVTYPGGEIQGTGDERREIGNSYNIGMNGDYYLFNHSALSASVHYSHRELVISRSLIGVSSQSIYRFSYIDFSFGYRHLFEILYLEGGVYYGIKIGNWTEDVDLGSNPRKVNDVNDNGRNEPGLYAGFGIIYPLMYGINLVMGLQTQVAVMYTYVDGDRLLTNQMMVKLGVEYRPHI